MATVMNPGITGNPDTSPAAASPVLGTYRQAAPLFVRADGCTLYDESGRGYLDFASGIGVNALGYGDAGVARAMQAALATGLVHTSNLYRTAPAVELADRLVRHSFADRVFFCNSGAESNEAAFKFARRWARTVGGAAKHEIVALRGAFHGRLFGALAATDRRAMQEPFEPLMPGVRFIDIDDLATAGDVVSAERTAAIIAEPVQGEGGVRPLPVEALRELRRLADEANALLIFDEVQCGLGRTGRMFAYETTGVIPDMMTLAKPLAGGLPMGATLLTDRVAAAVQPGDHATTFGGGPLVASVALEVLRRLAAPGFLDGVQCRGERLGALLDELTCLPSVLEARGVGMMWGLELTVPAGPVVAAALEAGLLVTPAGERVVRLLPPLVMDEGELARGVAILARVLS
ncbi:MAG TPA: acetylornithine/succinylornithine family transaminase [Longimicrobiales bacterium]|nr:acetylornithine/succinylornithine family transaminase [Longimicrobiales bacterium]